MIYFSAVLLPHPRDNNAERLTLEGSMKKRFYDRRWGGIGLTLAVAFIMCAASVFAATPNPTNDANGVSEVSATCDEVVAGATSVVVPLATCAPLCGSIDSPATVDLASNSTSPPNQRILMATTGQISTELTANMGGSTDAGFATSAEANDQTSMPNPRADYVPHRTTEETFRGAAPMTSTGNSFGGNVVAKTGQ